mgnify:CR=1 FL=1
MIIVSACLLGENCKYSGGNNKSENVIKYLEGKEYILVCPEQLGGLSTPRNPSEIITYGNKDGNDVLSGCTKVLSNKGIEKGEKNKAMEIAKSLINLGLDKEAISKSTGLDLGEIEKLMN